MSDPVPPVEVMVRVRSAGELWPTSMSDTEKPVIVCGDFNAYDGLDEVEREVGALAGGARRQLVATEPERLVGRLQALDGGEPGVFCHINPSEVLPIMKSVRSRRCPGGCSPRGASA